jgi:hypothetical protein
MGQSIRKICNNSTVARSICLGFEKKKSFSGEIRQDNFHNNNILILHKMINLRGVLSNKTNFLNIGKSVNAMEKLIFSKNCMLLYLL